MYIWQQGTNTVLKEKINKQKSPLLCFRKGGGCPFCLSLLVLGFLRHIFISCILPQGTPVEVAGLEDYSSVSLNPAILASSRIESLDTFLPLYSMRSSHCPVKISLGLYFLMMILSSSVKISKGSLSPISKLLRSCDSS